MAEVQDLFEKFHATIRTYYEINKTLREKKDIIVERVKAHLKEKKRPQCDEYIQGSYKMKVGICAIKGTEYDIDVGLRFSFDDSQYSAETVRQWVFEAVDGHTESVEKKAPCIRVNYADGYHVDLVCYCWWDDKGGVEQHRLAHKTNGWRPADPPALVEYVKDARKPFEGTEDVTTSTDQFRRVVRYLKRWNDEALPGERDDKPTGLALVLLTQQHLHSPAQNWLGDADDRTAVERVASAAAGTFGRIVAHKPTPEKEDMFARLSDTQMTQLKERFGKLRDALGDARNAKERSEACKRLKEVFGSDFPCPDKGGEGDKADARRTQRPAIVPSNVSAGGCGCP